MSQAGGKIIILSLLLSTANILGSSGLMIWVDYSIEQQMSFFYAYAPLIFYLLGLSLGCCVVAGVGFIYCRSVAITKRMLLLSCVCAFFLCFSLVLGELKEGCIVESIDLSLRFFWGWMSGASVVLTRVMLVVPKKNINAYTNFSILSLALACLPLMVPVLFLLGGFYQRSASAIGAAGLYCISVLMAIGIRLDDQMISRLPGERKYVGYISIVNFLNLIILNVCFFLLLMLVPMIKELVFSEVKISAVYISLLCLWCGAGVVCIKIGSRISNVCRLAAGVAVQIGVLVCCALMAYSEMQGLFYVVVILAFISNMLIQPVLYMSIGSHSRYRLLLFGLQSGVYIFIVCGLLVGIAYFELSVQLIFRVFWWMAFFSLIFSSVSLITVERSGRAL